MSNTPVTHRQHVSCRGALWHADWGSQGSKPLIFQVLNYPVCLPSLTDLKLKQWKEIPRLCLVNVSWTAPVRLSIVLITRHWFFINHVNLTFEVSNFLCRVNKVSWSQRHRDPNLPTLICLTDSTAIRKIYSYSLMTTALYCGCSIVFNCSYLGMFLFIFLNYRITAKDEKRKDQKDHPCQIQP